MIARAQLDKHCSQHFIDSAHNSLTLHNGTQLPVAENNDAQVRFPLQLSKIDTWEKIKWLQNPLD